jgi:fatty-acyl-CoA synthase
MLGLNQDFPLSLPTVLEHGAANYGATEIVSFGHGEIVRTNYAAVATRARRLASQLTGAMYGSLAWNTHRHLELFFAVSGTGAVLHTANPRLPPAQIAYTINFSGYRTLFIDLDTLALAEALAPQLTAIEEYVVMAPRNAIPATSLPNIKSYEDLIGAGDPNYVWPDIGERTAALLCFTSGTTGAPKGALYSHRGTVLNALSTGGGNGWGLNADDAILAVPGFFHCNGWQIPFFGPMYGTKLVLPGRSAETSFLHRTIVEEGITVGPGVPTIWLNLLEYCRETGAGLGRMNRIFSGGTAPPAAMMAAYLHDYGVRTIHGWGMTETTAGSTMSFAREDLAVMRTQGKPLYGNEIRAADDNGRPVPRDGRTPGNLQVRGHWVAGAYFKRPEVAFQTGDGWMETGDIAAIDPDNTLHLLDRAKDMVKSGGEWISSQALEEAALRHPAVLEAAVLAIPHPKWQERPFLVLVARPGAEPAEDDIRSHLSDIVPKWWLPDAIAFVDELPHGPTGKLAKNVLREWLKDGRLTLPYPNR